MSTRGATLNKVYHKDLNKGKIHFYRVMNVVYLRYIRENLRET